ncbi:hypothetical protein THAOC_28840 [Thalassiosira oceanica]|uniref:Uncharacterized protein n=1 Tax=Thalassiosira oceanica TaxID=159749 RepID=K0RZ53_THAOC|nr:hypothetical protein THAOC_28840 [Thalassiosira oceanica]|eukprot:EJK51942.1 hypothetical protein THAOC_28840 [Thalassiosira oceanica]
MEFSSIKSNRRVSPASSPPCVPRLDHRDVAWVIPVPSIGGPEKLHPHRPSTPQHSTHVTRRFAPRGRWRPDGAERGGKHTLIDPSPSGRSVGERTHDPEEGCTAAGPGGRRS